MSGIIVERGEPATWAHLQRKSALTIGNFDGVHRGHRDLIATLVASARRSDADAVVMTFDPHPRYVLDPDHCPKQLTTIDERALLLEALGVDRMLVLPFTREVSEWSAQSFLDALAGALDLCAIVVGRDFAFGHGRQGTLEFLQTWGAAHHVDVTGIDLLTDGDPVSSTRVRDALQTGDVERAAQLLGQHFVIEGRVVEGKKVGAKIGFPTANIEHSEQMMLPALGVYGGWIEVDDEWHRTAVSVGTRETFGGRDVVVEAFILDFDRDIYGATVRCAFATHLRRQERYWTTDELIAQIGRDVERVRSTLPIAPLATAY